MKVYEFTLRPLSAFGTPLKGDTIFGQFCWQVANDHSLASGPLPELLADYSTNPFLVFSSAFPVFTEGGRRTYALRIPSLPIEWLFEVSDDRVRIMERKELKKKRWMLLSMDDGLDVLSGRDDMFLSDGELLERIRSCMSTHLRSRPVDTGLVVSLKRSHNTINRLTGTTGTGTFAPFTLEDHVYMPGTELVVFAGIDESRIDVAGVRMYLQRIGLLGFGRDASTGRGRFEVLDTREVWLDRMGSTSPGACYTLSPCVPGTDEFRDIFFTPFTRFGRHGDVLARSSNPFKSPVIMADEGAVMVPSSDGVFSRPYVGRAVKGISKVEGGTVSQGYSLYIPVRIER